MEISSIRGLPDMTTPPDSISQGTLLGNHNNYVFKACQEAKKTGKRYKHSQPQDHIIAERKRREKLSQRFIALSALVPGLQKCATNNRRIKLLFLEMLSNT
ncbi:hypothetical protein AAZV13_08G058350 [Glycine max]